MKNSRPQGETAPELQEAFTTTGESTVRSSAWLRSGKNLWLPMSWGCTGRRKCRRGRQAGFSFPELLMSILIATIIVSSLLPLVARSVESHRAIRQRRLDAIELWNQAQRFRADPDSSAEKLVLASESLTLSRLSAQHPDLDLVWEILHVH